MNQDKKLNIAFAGGGSGGHVMPISSLIRYIYKSEKYSDLVDNIFWFGQKGQMEEKEFEKLESEYFPTKDSISNTYIGDITNINNIDNILPSIKFPLLIHGEEKTGSSYYTVALVKKLIESKKKIVFFSKYDYAKDLLFDLGINCKYIYTSDYTNNQEIGDNDLIILKSGEEQDLIEFINNNKNNTSDYIYLIKNCDSFDAKKIIEKLPDNNYIISGNADIVDIDNIIFYSKILFSNYLNNKIQSLNKYDALFINQIKSEYPSDINNESNLSGLIIDNNTNTENIQNIKAILLQKGFTTIDVISRENFDFGKQDNYDIYILSGGHDTKSANHLEFYDNEIELLKSDKNIVGICLGMQIIAKYFGSNIIKNDKKIEGNIYINYNNNKYEVREAHNYIINKLGEELEGLAESEYGYEIIKHKNKNIYGLQFHPEKYIRIQDGDEIFESIIDKIKKDNLNINKLGINNNSQKALDYIIEILDNNNFDYCIIGGLAAKFYGSDRSLADIDIDVNDTNLVKIMDIAKEYSKGIQIYEDDQRKINILTLNYHGQIIELCGIESAEIFDHKIGKFTKYDNKLDSIDIYIDNKKYKVKGKNELLDYKSKIARSVDIYDIKELKSDNSPSINNNNLKFLPILSGKLRRQPDFKEILLNIADIFKFVIGIFQSLWYIYINKIDVVFCKGGYVALPAVFAAKILGRRILVHESDTKSGLVNKMAARFADKVYTGFPGVLAREQVVGQIISDNIVPSENLSTQSDKKTILVNLGSLGSASVHDALLDIFNKFPNVILEYEWHIILGSLNADYEDKYQNIIDKVAINRASTKSSLHIYTFVDQKVMGVLLYKTDISICRGGTTTLAEQKMFGIKQLIIPIPWTHDQVKNADYYVHHHQDIYIKQDKSASILGDNIYKEIIGLNNFRKTQPDLNQIRQQIQTAKKIICDEIFGL